jgi:hypothetical protein
MTRDADFKAIVRARARRRGVPYAQARREEVARGPRAAPATLHVTNGESAAMTIRQTSLDGPVLSWRDLLNVGPVPAGSAAELRAARAHFLAAWSDGEVAAIERELEQRDAALLGPHQRYVLWFEADLYDQLQLIQVLDMLADANVAPERIELVSAGEFPGVAHFGGLGELAADALAGLYEERVTLTADAIALARRAWTAFRAPDPTELGALASARSRELRFLGEAIARLLQEYPWRGDGLSLTERRILQVVGDDGTTAFEVFRRVWARESRPFQGDHVVFAHVRALAECAHPLVELGGDGTRFGERTVALTEMGRFALAGSFDHVTLNGPDRWIGGVHLNARNRWCYDPRGECVERDGPP